MKSALGLMVLLGLCYGTAWLGANLTAGSMHGWYQSLRKPAWNPPRWVFGPVWLLLYTLMAVAAWLAWREAPQARLPMVLFALQLGLNLAWSLLFFGCRAPGLALLDLMLLWLAILATGLVFFSLCELAGWLMVPYLAWVTFAGLLNHWIWRHN